MTLCRITQFFKEKGSLAEWSLPIWNSGLTQIKISGLEIIIHGDAYKSYDLACEHFKIETLSSRRFELCTNYAIKLYKSEKSCDFFIHTNNLVNTRSEKLLVEQNCNTIRCCPTTIWPDWLTRMRQESNQVWNEELKCIFTSM